MFRRIYQVLCIFTKNNGFIRNDIEGNVLFYRVVRVIPHKIKVKLVLENTIIYEKIML